VCKALYHGLCHCSELRLFGCLLWIFHQNFSVALHVKVLQKISPNFLVARSHQNQCCVLVSGSFDEFHCNEVLGLHRVLILFSIAQACRNAGSQTC
jgi:hypothetical protein